MQVLFGDTHCTNAVLLTFVKVWLGLTNILIVKETSGLKVTFSHHTGVLKFNLKLKTLLLKMVSYSKVDWFYAPVSFNKLPIKF